MTAPRKTTKKAAAPKAAPKPAPEEKAEQTDPVGGVAIANQAVFARSLGLNPDVLVANSMRIEFNPQGVAFVSYSAVMGVSPQQLAYAFMASSGMLGAGADGQSTPIPDAGPGEG